MNMSNTRYQLRVSKSGWNRMSAALGSYYRISWDKNIGTRAGVVQAYHYRGHADKAGFRSTGR